MPKRFNTIDVMRGITVALMIFVNVSGLSQSYAFFTHAPWDGCTLADWVFPSFLFIVGFSIGLANKKEGKRILKRVVILFLIGLALNFLFRPDITHVRILGVLQRIAICYGVVAWLHYKTKPMTQALIAVLLLLGYWALLLISPDVVGGVDRLFLQGHLLTPVFDPEGILSTFPAIAQTLLGLLTYYSFERIQSPGRRVLLCVSIGILCCAFGLLWGEVFPINKSLWTSSYVLFTTGLSLIFLAGIYVGVDLRAFRGLDWFKIIGQQALLLYILHLVLIKFQLMLHFKEHIILKAPGGLSIQNATLIYALLFTLFFIGLGLLINIRDRGR